MLFIARSGSADKETLPWASRPTYVMSSTKNREYVALGRGYGGKSVELSASLSPLGPFTKHADTRPAFGLPGDSAVFVGDDQKAYVIYNQGTKKQNKTKPAIPANSF
jgi:hypothetical protein